MNIEKREKRVKLNNNNNNKKKNLITNQIISDALRFGWNEFQCLLLSVVDVFRWGGNELQRQLFAAMRWVAEDTGPERRETIWERSAELRVGGRLDEALHVVQVLGKRTAQRLRQRERGERRDKEHSGERGERERRRDGEQQRREHRRRASDARRDAECARAARRREELAFDQEDHVVRGGHEEFAHNTDRSARDTCAERTRVVAARDTPLEG